MRGFWVKFQYRTISCLVLICLMLLFCIVRIISICNDSRTVSNTSNTVTVELQGVRGDIYDCNGKKITSSVLKYAVVFLPCDKSILRYAAETTGEIQKNGLERLRQKKPAVLIRDEAIRDIGIYSFEIRDRYSQINSLEHLIGYIDAEKHGVTGLEKAFDELLYTDNTFTVSFVYDAFGDFLLGSEPIVNSNIADSAIYLTIDNEIQRIVSSATENINKGAAVVSEISTGKIRAMVSKPGFEINNLSQYINRDDSPFLNRALSAYSVGSVFKPIIAAAMLEYNKGNFTNDCKGYSEFLGLRFYCNKHEGHGLLDLKGALALSCNTYFYNGSLQVPPKALTSISSSFGFGNDVTLAKGILADGGSITSLNTLEKSTAAVANFSIGQGNISLSPLVLCNLYSAIANDGVYFTPSLIEGIIENGVYKREESGEKNVVLSKATAAVLKENLISVVENGTGISAKPNKIGAGGKTATAQTGQYNGSTELLNAWFCGFFPASEPKYVVVVMAEDAFSGSEDCGPVFKKIAEGISKIDKN